MASGISSDVKKNQSRFAGARLKLTRTLCSISSGGSRALTRSATIENHQPEPYAGDAQTYLAEDAVIRTAYVPADRVRRR